MTKYIQGKFLPLNPKKYKGDVTNIFARSSWEFVVFSRLDKNPDVIWWSSEEVVVHYTSPIDGQTHRYFPDLLYSVRQKDGSLKTVLAEIKPKSQCEPPKIKNIKSKRYLTEVKTYGINQAKWAAAEIYAAKRGWSFFVLTEKDLKLV